MGLTSRLVLTHDVPELLVRCLRVRPWIRRGSGSCSSNKDVRGGGGDKVFQGSDWQVR